VSHWNVQGIVGKIEEIYCLSHKFHTDVICICEHWVSRDNLSDCVIPGFKLVSAYHRPTCNRGGTAIFIRSALKSVELTYLVDLSIQSTCEVAAAYIEDVNVICLEIYRVPDNENFDAFIECLHNVLNILYHKNKNYASVVLCCDYNVDILGNDMKKYVLENCLLSFNLRNTVCEVTRPNWFGESQGTCIDNISVSIHPSRIIRAFVEPTIMSDHHSIILQSNLISKDSTNRPTVDSRINRLVRPIEDFNSVYFGLLLGKVNWLPLYTLSTIDEKFEYFLNIFLNIVDTVFPVKYINNCTNRPKRPKWYSDRLVYLKNRCLYIYKLYKSTGQDCLRETYRDLRSSYRKELRIAKLSYNCDRVSKAKNKPKVLWSIVKECLNSNESPTYNSDRPSSSLSSDGFNDFFINNVKLVRQGIPEPIHDVSFYLNRMKQISPQKYNNIGSCFLFSNVSVESVHNAIQSLSNSTSLDLFNLNSKVLKLASPFIVEVLSYLFNICIDCCVVPQCFKMAKVVPLFKKGEKSEYSNYRPVSIIPVISKVFEIILNAQVINYFENYFLFSEHQYGFRPKRGTNMAIANYMKECIINVDAKRKVTSNFYDMSKAFDTIDHSILLSKLKFYGFHDNSLNLIQSYLTERYQSVVFNGFQSQYLQVTTGVPQGSVLGPTMFIVYVNDLPVAISNACLSSYLYADDIAIQISCTNHNLANQLLSHSSSVIEDWTAANALCLNNDKTQNLNFNVTVYDDIYVKFLGVHLQSNLKWKSHILNVCKKIAKGIFMLRRLKSDVTVDVLLSVYFAHIQSHILYGIVVWGCDRNIVKILLLQKRALRIICNVGRRAHCKPIFQKLGVLTVTSLYLLELLLYVKSNLSNISTNNCIHDHFTRQNSFLRSSQCNYRVTMKSTFELGKKLYNLLPYDIKCLDIKQFKVSLRSLLLKLSVYDIDEFIGYLRNKPNS